MPCSGHGTCISDPNVDGGTPYCSCDHYNTNSPTYNGECEAQGLQIQSNGWCAYFDATLGFAACQTQGMCGICQDTSPAVRAQLQGPAVHVWVVLLATVLLSID